MDTSRVIVCAPNDSMLFEVATDDMWACNEVMEINGQHYLEIVTTRVLSKEQRVIVFDEAERAHEYVVASEDREHSGGSRPFGTYRCPWSLQHDARLWKVNTSVGTDTPANASAAMSAALSGTSRWTRGAVTVGKSGSAVMARMSGWQALSVVLEVWGGEIDATVTVGPTGVTSRTVSLYEAMGEATAKRRFDFSRDMTSIARRVLQDDVACRIVPLGKTLRDSEGNESRVTIEEANGGVEWLQNDESAALYRLPNSTDGWEFPSVYVENGDIEDPAELLAWGRSVLDDYTVPRVSYTMEVTHLYHEDLNPYGVGLGDVVQGVDKAFGDTALRIEARVTAMTIDRLDRSRSTVTVSNASGNGGQLASSVSSAIRGINSRIEALSTMASSSSEVLGDLLNNLNAQINATGGYTYVVQGHGWRTYDTAVSDPLVGAEAHRVVELRGGSIRFANTKTSQGEWVWSNVITPDGYIGLAATIARITSGFIGSSDSSSYWDLDTDTLVVGGRTAGEINEVMDGTIASSLSEYVQNSSNVTVPLEDAAGWSANAPTWRHGAFMWKRTSTTYGDGTVVHSRPTCISSDIGSSVTTSGVEIGVSNTSSVLPETWDRALVASSVSNKWMWARTTHTDDSVTTCKLKMTTGSLSATAMVQQYYLSTSYSALAGGDWLETEPTWVSGRYLWERYRVTWSNNTTAYTDAVYAAGITETLETAHKASAAAWVEVSSVAVDVEFAVGHHSNVAPDALSASWSSVAVLPTEQTSYLWMRDAVTVNYGSRSILRHMNPRLVTPYDEDITEVRGMYFLSTSPDALVGGSWLNVCPAWNKTSYIWTCAQVVRGGTWSQTAQMPCVVGVEQSAAELAYGAYGRIDDVERGLVATETRLQFAIENAAKTATDFLRYEDGELTLGSTDSAIKNVMTNVRQEFRNQAGAIAYFGQGADEVWRLYVQNAQILDMLMFGRYAWITRENGNMSIKWVE